jgi:hypothetical protein
LCGLREEVAGVRVGFTMLRLHLPSRRKIIRANRKVPFYTFPS